MSSWYISRASNHGFWKAAWNSDCESHKKCTWNAHGSHMRFTWFSQLKFSFSRLKLDTHPHETHSKPSMLGFWKLYLSKVRMNNELPRPKNVWRHELLVLGPHHDLRQEDNWLHENVIYSRKVRMKHKLPEPGMSCLSHLQSTTASKYLLKSWWWWLAEWQIAVGRGGRAKKLIVDGTRDVILIHRSNLEDGLANSKIMRKCGADAKRRSRRILRVTSRRTSRCRDCAFRWYATNYLAIKFFIFRGMPTRKITKY